MLEAQRLRGLVDQQNHRYGWQVAGTGIGSSGVGRSAIVTRLLRFCKSKPPPSPDGKSLIVPDCPG